MTSDIELEQAMVGMIHAASEAATEMRRHHNDFLRIRIIIDGFLSGEMSATDALSRIQGIVG